MVSATDQVLEIIEKLAVEQDTFTSDDIRPFLPDGVSTRSIPSAVGKARRDGIIEEIGRTRSVIPERKGSQVGVFRRMGSTYAFASTASSGQPDKSNGVSATSQEIVALRHALEGKGYLTGVEEVASILLMMASRTWLILSGPSGTGKSSIVRHLSEALSASIHDVQVKPNWISSEDSLGYYSEASQRFVPGVLTTAIVEAMEDDTKGFHFIRLDEMNLASPEYYLAEVLSAAENWNRQADGGSLSDQIQLPPVPVGVETPQVAIPDTVFLIGTVNIDETTRGLSPKVLDRAAVYELRSVDLFGIPSVSGEGNSPMVSLPNLNRMLRDRPHSVVELTLLDGLLAEVGELLTDLNVHAASLGGPIAYRQRDAILTMVSLAEKYQIEDILPRPAVIDIGLRSVILPKWQGSTQAAVSSLRGVLAVLLEAESVNHEITVESVRSRIPGSKYPRTLEKLAEMLEQAARLGYFSAW